MYDRETVELALYALEEGMSQAEAAELVGASRSAVSGWARGAVPHGRAARPPKRTVVTEAMRAEARVWRAAGIPVAEIADALGTGQTTVYNLTKDVEPLEKEGPVEKPTEVDPKASPEVRELQARVRALELEKAAMEEVLAVLKAGLPCADREMRGRERTAAAAALAARGFSVSEACSAMGLPRSTFYYHASGPQAAPRDRAGEVRPLVEELFELGRRRWGYRTIWARMRRAGVRVSEKTVRRVMREGGMRVAYGRRRRRYSSYGGEISQAPPNLVARDFSAGAPNEKWLTDITEFRLPDDSKVYLSPVVDCFDGRVVAWSAGTRPDAELANSSLRRACEGLAEGERPVVHSDRGCHYRWPGWIAICEEHGLVRSMSAKGCSPDNSACEGLFGRLKNEFFYHEDWQGVGAGEFMERLGGYLEYYNEGRIKRSLGWMSPDEYRRSKGYAV